MAFPALGSSRNSLRRAPTFYAHRSSPDAVPDALTLVILAILVFLVAFTFANVGLGGGGLYVPILLLLYVDNEDIVVPISLSLAAATSISSTLNHSRKGFVDLRIGIVLMAGALLGVIVGTELTLSILNTSSFKLFFIALLTLIGISLLYRWRSGSTVEVDDDSRKTRGRVVAASAAEASSGFISGSAGVGGGVLNVPILSFILGRKTRTAVGTSSLIIIPTTLFGFLLFGVRQSFPVEFNIIPILFPLTLIGGYIGSRWGLKALRTKSIGLLFIGFVFLAAGLVVLDVLGVL